MLCGHGIEHKMKFACISLHLIFVLRQYHIMSTQTFCVFDL